MDWTLIAYYIVGTLVFLEAALAIAAKIDARDGKVDLLWLSRVAYVVHMVASYAMLIPEAVLPFKLQVPFMAAVRRYKDLKGAVHVDDLPLEPWEKREPPK